MTATPRIVRTIALPSAPRLRRVAGVNTRPLGKISLFLAATCVFGLTSLCYLWQTSQAVTTSYQIRDLNQRLAAARNTETELEDSIRLQQTYSAVYEAALKLGMVTVDPSTAHFITLPAPVTVKYVVSYIPPRPVARAVHVSTTNAAMASWWQGLWSALYHLMH